MGGNISGQSMLFAKSGLELLILTLFHGQNQFDRPLTWVLVAFLIVTAILQVCVCSLPFLLFCTGWESLMGVRGL